MQALPRLARSLVPVLLAVTLAGGLAPPAGAEPRTLADNTVVDRWTLPCGLKVVTRHVPLAQAVAITACYPFGTDHDPPGLEGASSLLAEVGFTAAAGDVPERAREEMQGLRPLGWGVKVSRHFTQLIEVSSYQQFPGVLRQVCQRLRGVTVTPAGLRAAVASVKAEMADNYKNRTASALYYLAGELSSGTSSEGAERHAAGAGLDRLTVRDVQGELGKQFGPAGAVLCIVGNLKDYDLRRILENELGSLAPGAQPDTLWWGQMTSAQACIAREGLSEPLGVVGIVAPALSDTLHPSFYAYMLALGAFCTSRWGPPSPPLTTRFQFSVSDDPQLARLYPPVTPADPPRAVEELRYAVLTFASGGVDSAQRVKLLEGVQWLLGAPLPRELQRVVKLQPGVLSSLCSNMAARELYGDETFWADYRRRVLDHVGPRDAHWHGYVLDPQRQVELVFTPAR